MNALKNWFFALSKREQYTVAVGGILVAVLLFYWLIWSPLSAHVDGLRQNVSDHQQLLVYAEQVKKKLLHSRGKQTARPIPVTNIMVDVEHALAEAHLAKYLKRVQQPATDEVTISLQAVPFDLFIAWLQHYVESRQVNVAALQATKNKTLGTADVQFTLLSKP